jgi:hypothetical protein
MEYLKDLKDLKTVVITLEWGDGAWHLTPDHDLGDMTPEQVIALHTEVLDSEQISEYLGDLPFWQVKALARCCLISEADMLEII